MIEWVIVLALLTLLIAIDTGPGDSVSNETVGGGVQTTIACVPGSIVTPAH